MNRSRARAILLRTPLVWNPVIATAFAIVIAGFDDLPRRVLVSLVIAEVATIQGFAAVLLVRRLDDAFARRRGRAPVARGSRFHVGLVIATLPLTLPLAFAAGGAVARSIGMAWSPPDLASYRFGIGFGLVVAFVVFVQHARSEAQLAARTAEARAAEAERLRLEAQLAALTAEIDPHLLFNALNTVAALIHRAPDRAEEVVVRLAELYRGILRAAGTTTHALRDELRLIEAYLEVERARFGDRLAFSLAVDPGLPEISIPVLLLQPFVENAVKHGIGPRAGPGEVAISLRVDGGEIRITIEDDGVGLGRSPSTGTGRGIENGRARLALAYGARATLEIGAREGGGTRVVIVLVIEGDRFPLRSSDRRPLERPSLRIASFRVHPSCSRRKASASAGVGSSTRWCSRS